MLEKILRRLHEKDLEQQELEAMAGLPKGRMSKWNKGQGEPTARQAARIARVLNLDIEFLLDDEQDVPIDSDAYERRRVFDLIADLGYEEAFRRLAVVPASRKQAVDEGYVEFTPQELSASTTKRLREDDKPKSSRRADLKPTGQDKESDPAGMPARR